MSNHQHEVPMQDDIDPVSGQPVPVLTRAQQIQLAELMVDHLLEERPVPVMSEFTRRFILERQRLDYEHPFDEDARHA